MTLYEIIFGALIIGALLILFSGVVFSDYMNDKWALRLCTAACVIFITGMIMYIVY
jgi:hypothetical protein